MTIKQKLINWLAGKNLFSELDDRNQKIYQLQNKLNDSVIQVQKMANSLSILRGEKDMISQDLLDASSSLKSANKDLCNKDNEIHDLRQEIESLKNELVNVAHQVQQRTTALNSLQEEKDTVSKDLNELQILLESAKRDLVFKDSELQSSKNEIERLNKEIEDVETHYKDKEKEHLLTISQLEEENNLLKEENQRLKNELKELRDSLSNIPAKTELPVITNEITKGIKRSIQSVDDVINNETINSQTFFENQSVDYISYFYRRLLIAERMGETLYVCHNCKQPVKILKVSRNGQENMRFVHCKKEPYCSRRPESVDYEHEAKDVVPFGDEERLLYIKELMQSVLSSKESIDRGFTNVAIDANVHGSSIKGSWRNIDVVVDLLGSKICIELQRIKDTNTYIVDRDEFFRINNYQSIWVFGAESAFKYDYLRGVNFKSTLYANHKNVFIFDEEAEKESIQRKELVLKCNWLDSDGKWHFKQPDCNGILVTLDQLRADENNGRLYYYDANKEDALPNSDISNVEDSQPGSPKSESELSEIKIEPSSIISEPQKTERSINEEPDGLLICPGYYKIQRPNGYYLISKTGVPVSYTPFYNILPWAENCFRVCNIYGLWGIINRLGGYVCECKYSYLGDFQGSYAKALKGNIETRVNINGEEIIQKEHKLRNGLYKIQFASKWGIRKEDGTIVVETKYDEIGSIDNKICLFYNGHVIVTDIIYNYPIPLTGFIKSLDHSKAVVTFGANDYQIFICKTLYSQSISEGKLYNSFAAISVESDYTRMVIAERKKILSSKFLPMEAIHKIKVGQNVGMKVISIIKEGLYGYQFYNQKSLLLKSYKEDVYTIVPQSTFEKYGFDINVFKVDNILQLQKVGIDEELGISIWKINRKY